MPGTFHFVEPGNIDAARWDETIKQCYNENPFAYSAWLDLTSPGWGALINKEHTALMPLALKKKFGIYYIAQPRFTQQLGIFSTRKITEKTISRALGSIPKKILKVTMQMNTGNYFETLGLKSRPTYCIDMNSGYPALFNQYHLNHKRNISKAKNLALVVRKENNRTEFVKHYRQTAGKKDKSLKPADFELMNKIMALLLNSGKAEILCCYDAHGELMAGLFYTRSETRIINLFNFSTAAGRGNNAMAFLIDHWISKFAGSKLILDFEGSSIPTLATFYSRFGAEAKLYPVFTRKGLW